MTWYPSFARSCTFCGGLRRAGHDEECAAFYASLREVEPVVVKPFPAPQPCGFCLQPLEPGAVCRCELTFAGNDAWGRDAEW